MTDDITIEGDPHPLKTFTNLASGNLQENDCILTSNLELYSEISLDALRRIINSSSPYQSCQAIAKELKKEKNIGVSPIIIKVISALDSEKIITPEPTEINLEEELQSPLRKLQKKLQPILSKLIHHAKEGSKIAIDKSKQVYSTAQEKIGPKASELLQKGTAQVVEMKAKVKAKTTKPEKLPVVEYIAPATAQPELVAESTPSQLPTNPEVTPIIPASDLALDSASTLPASLADKPESRVSNLIGKGKEFIVTPNGKKTLALVAALFLILLTVKIVNGKRHPAFWWFCHRRCARHLFW